METLWQDVRYGFRMMVRNPRFAAVVVVIMAVSIGANVAIFSVVDTVLLNPLPYRDANRIVALWEEKKAEGIEEMATSPRNFDQWREQNHVFERLAAWQNRTVQVTGLDEPREIKVVAVSPDLFPLLGVSPFLGRGFLQEEEQNGKDRVVILSHGFWSDAFGAASDPIGKTLRLDGDDYTIVGIMPSGFEFPVRQPAPLWVPLALPALDTRSALLRSLPVVARLRKGVTLKEARADMAVIGHRLEQVDPRRNTGFSVCVVPLLDDAVKGNRTWLSLLLMAVGLVLLVACSNTASLMCARAAARQGEIAVRMAIGASRGRIVRQVLTESLVLGTVAGLLGLLLAFCVIKGGIGLCPADIPRIGETRIDAPVLVFAFALSVFTGLAFGLMPAWKTANAQLAQPLKEGRGRMMIGPGWQRFRGGLVIAQIGIALTLLVGTALLIRSLISMQKADLGFRPQNVLTMQIQLPRTRYPESQQCQAFFDEVLRRVQALPGVRAAALICGRLDLAGGGWYMPFSITGRPPAENPPRARMALVTPDFFGAMGIPVLKGRSFTDQDMQDSQRGVIIDENLARHFFADVDPIGQQIDGASIVGVVHTLRDFEVMAPTHNAIYKPVTYFQSMSVVIRTKGDPMYLAKALRAEVRALDKDLPVPRVRTLEDILSKMLAPRRLSAILLSVLGGIALMLACVGIYGLLQYMVTQEMHGIGIRMALGARHVDILTLVLGRGFTLTLIGLSVGLAGALALGRAISSLLYNVSPIDLLTLAGVSFLLAGAALLASYLPARRAARTDPMAALRYE